MPKAAIRSDAKLHSCYCQPRANLVGKVGNNGHGQVKTKIRRKLSFDIELAWSKVAGGGLSCNHNHGKVLTKPGWKCRLAWEGAMARKREGVVACRLHWYVWWSINLKLLGFTQFSYNTRILNSRARIVRWSGCKRVGRTGVGSNARVGSLCGLSLLASQLLSACRKKCSCSVC